MAYSSTVLSLHVARRYIELAGRQRLDLSPLFGPLPCRRMNPLPWRLIRDLGVCPSNSVSLPIVGSSARKRLALSLQWGPNARCLACLATQWEANSSIRITRTGS